ncbi:hypothetical protein HED60_17080 [Planctomycetales bacterium ZRK34]|nr:hypothetical protein HED60_17080 [Planctomycetales bacterium ZRK34]
MMMMRMMMVLMLAAAIVIGDEGGRVIEYGEPIKRGDLENKAINESSGLAVSRIHRDLYWTHNDSGNAPVLFAIGPNGEDRAMFTLVGLRARDWEDMASCTLDGKPYLLIGDVGDNQQTHQHGTLILVPEPDVKDIDHHRRAVIKPERLIHFVYEDGPANCEAIVVDAAAGKVLLIQKVALGACGVYELPLSPPAAEDEAPNARRMYTAKRIGQSWINMVTGADLSHDGRRLIISTYGPSYELTRTGDETWADVFKKQPRRVDMPRRRQGESICYDTDGESLLLTSEKRPTPLWYIPAKKN